MHETHAPAWLLGDRASCTCVEAMDIQPVDDRPPCADKSCVHYRYYDSVVHYMKPPCSEGDLRIVKLVV